MKIVIVYILIKTQYCLYLNKVLLIHGYFESKKSQIPFFKSQDWYLFKNFACKNRLILDWEINDDEMQATSRLALKCHFSLNTL